MLSLKDACAKVMSNHPDEYIHRVNEFPDAYEFVLMNKGEQVTIGTTGLLPASIVNKQTGEITDGLLAGEYMLGSRPIRQYKKEEVERGI